MAHCQEQLIFNPFTGTLQFINAAVSSDVAHAADVLAKGTAAAVAATSKTTIVTLVASLKVQFITKIVLSGHDYAKFFLTVDSVDESIKRSGPDRTLEWDFTNPFSIAIGSVVDIKVEHFATGETPTFEATIWGFS